jgi:hypothetical protein
MRLEPGDEEGPRGGAGVLALTIVYLIVLPCLAYSSFMSGLGPALGGQMTPEIQRSLHHGEQWLIGIAMGGPVLIAAVAFAGRLRRTGVVYLVIAALIGVVALVAVESGRSPAPAPTGPAVQTGCRTGSGKCRGG